MGSHANLYLLLYTCLNDVILTSLQHDNNMKSIYIVQGSHDKKVIVTIFVCYDIDLMLHDITMTS